MGRGRSLRKLYALYSEISPDSPDSAPPTASYDTLRIWSQKYDWADRAVLYDYEWEKKRTEIAHAQMLSGIALSHVRLREISELYALLIDELYEEEEIEDDERTPDSEEGETVLRKLWVKDVKNVGSGDFTRPVTIRRYNAAIIADIRGLLDDAAKETGGRKPKDETAALLQMLVAKVGLENIPDAVLERMSKGESAYAVMFDIINNLQVPNAPLLQGSTPVALPEPPKIAPKSPPKTKTAKKSAPKKAS